MGCIGYPIQYYHLQRASRELLENTAIDINFPIGALEIAANREELQYSDFTKKALSLAVEIICNEIAEKVSERFEHCKTMWDARCLYVELFSNYSSVLYHVRNTVGQKTTWRGQKIATSSGCNISNVGDATTYDIYSNNNGRLTVRRINEQHVIVPSENTQLMIDDLDTKSGEKIRSWMKHDGLGVKKVCLIELSTWNEDNENKLHATLGTIPNSYKLTSSLPKPIRNAAVKRSSVPRSKVPIYARGFIFDETRLNYYSSNEKDAWIKKDIDIKKEGVFIPWRKNMAIDGNSSASPNTIKQTLELLEKIGKKPTVTYAFKEGYVSSALVVNPKWKNFFRYAEEELHKFIKDKKIADLVKAKQGSTRIEEFDKLQKVAEHIHQPSPLKKFVNTILGAQKARDDIDTAISLGNHLKVSLGKTSSEKEVKGIMDRYPMLKWFDEGYYYQTNNPERYETAAKYVESIDRAEV